MDIAGVYHRYISTVAGAATATTKGNQAATCGAISTATANALGKDTA